MSERRCIGRENGLYLIQEPDGAVTRHETNPLVPAAPESTDAPQDNATKYPRADLNELRALEIETATGQALRKALKAAGVDAPAGAKKVELADLAAATLAAASEAPDDEDGDEEAPDDEDGEGGK